jgi:hypothetical protein
MKSSNELPRREPAAGEEVGAGAPTLPSRRRFTRMFQSSRYTRTWLAVEAPGDLGVSVTIEAQDGEVVSVVVAGIAIQVVDLDRTAPLAADATGAVRQELDLGCEVLRDGRAIPVQSRVHLTNRASAAGDAPTRLGNRL